MISELKLKYFTYRCDECNFEFCESCANDNSLPWSIHTNNSDSNRIDNRFTLFASTPSLWKCDGVDCKFLENGCNSSASPNTVTMKLIRELLNGLCSYAGPSYESTILGRPIRKGEFVNFVAESINNDSQWGVVYTSERKLYYPLKDHSGSLWEVVPPEVVLGENVIRYTKNNDNYCTLCVKSSSAVSGSSKTFLRASKAVKNHPHFLTLSASDKPKKCNQCSKKISSYVNIPEYTCDACDFTLCGDCADNMSLPNIIQNYDQPHEFHLYEEPRFHFGLSQQQWRCGCGSDSSIHTVRYTSSNPFSVNNLDRCIHCTTEKQVQRSTIAASNHSHFLKLQRGRAFDCKGESCSSSNKKLMKFLGSNNYKSLEELLDTYNEDTSIIRDKHGNTPLLLALKQNHIECAKLLISHQRTDLNAQNNAGDNCLLYCMKEKIGDILDILLSDEVRERINFKLCDANSNNVLHLTFLSENYDAAKKLVTVNKDLINGVNKRNVTPFNLLIRNFLQQQGASEEPLFMPVQIRDNNIVHNIQCIAASPMYSNYQNRATEGVDVCSTEELRYRYYNSKKKNADLKENSGMLS